MSIRCLIVDDEPLAVEVLESYVARMDSLEHVGSCNNAVKAFDILKNEAVDVLFLDIQMPKLTGIEFLKILHPAPRVIFTTAYRDYAVESYELNVVDYLLKPIAFDRFMMAINKVMDVDINKPHESPAEAGQEDEPFLFLKADRKMVKVMLNDITYIESLKDYVRVKKVNGKEVISHQKISYLEKKLPSDCFVRIHKSYIISRHKMEAYSASAVEIAGVEIPIGRSYKAAVMDLLGSTN